MEGLRLHSQVGQNTLTNRDLLQPGGTFISSFGICPVVTAWRCSQMASMCQFGMKGTISTWPQASFTNSIRGRVHIDSVSRVRKSLVRSATWDQGSVYFAILNNLYGSHKT